MEIPVSKTIMLRIRLNSDGTGNLIAASASPPYEEVTKGINALMQAFKELGCSLESLLTALEFITLVTIEKLKICPKGSARMERGRYEPIDVSA